MNYYYCKICEKRGENFSGTRYEVRKHLREEHLIKKGKTTISTKGKERTIGNKTINMGAKEWK